jgi:hypothetical protein
MEKYIAATVPFYSFLKTYASPLSSLVLPPSQIINYSKNLGESKHFKFDKKYKINYKKL